MILSINILALQLSVGTGCLAILNGFDKKYNTCGGAGKIVDLSTAALCSTLLPQEKTVQENGMKLLVESFVRRQRMLEWTVVVLVAVVVALILLVGWHNMLLFLPNALHHDGPKPMPFQHVCG